MKQCNLLAWTSTSLCCLVSLMPLLSTVFYNSTTLGDSNSLVESLTSAVGGSCIRIWMRTNGWSSLTTSLSRVSWDTGRTKVSIPSAASVQVLIFQGRLTRRSTKIRSTRDERETANASVSMKPPRLAVICTVPYHDSKRVGIKWDRISSWTVS